MLLRTLVGAFVSMCVTTAPAMATTYYVGASGSDGNSGTSPAQAWASLSRINNQTFSPGDRILLEGGHTFSGSLYFDAADAGTVSAPVVISSYGSGRATIYAASGHGILGYNTAGFRITDLYVVGAGRDVSTGSGIFFYNDLAGDVLLDGLEVARVDAVRFRDYGVEIGAHNVRSGFRNIRITHVIASENGLGGIFTYAQVRAVHRNVYVGYSSAASNTGFRGLLYNSGNGIALSGVDGGTIEYSVAHHNGARSDADNGPVGIWAFHSNNVVIQFSESYSNATGGTKDGGGFHLDNSTSNSVLQYNYSHDNAGAGYMLAHKWNDFIHSGNVIRWNVSQNDARRNNYAAIHLWGRIRNAQIYNNTVYLAAGNSIARAMHARNNTIETQDLENVRIANNIFVSTGGLALVDFSTSVLDNSTGVRLEGNDYWSSGAAFRILWKGTTYSSLAAFRTATGQERLNNADVGRSVDPELTAPGAGGAFNDAEMMRGLWQYRLKASSQLIDAGVDLAQAGIDPGARDFFGGPSRRFAADIGAHEFDTDCSWSVSPPSVSVGVGGGTGTVSVWALADNCGWAALPSSSWLTASPSSGSGPATLTFAAGVNAGAARSSTIWVGSTSLAVSQAGASAPPPPPPPGNGDIGSWSQDDIGSTGVAGSGSGDGTSFTITGGGADIWGSADAFHFIQQQVSGDWEIEGRIATVQNVHAWTKAGLMIRETLGADSRHASMLVTPGKGLSFQYRAATAGASAAIAAGTGTAPQWIRLTRRGSTISAAVRAPDGSWPTVATTTIAMAASVYVGLVISSHDATRAATATFESVTLRSLSAGPPPPPPPPPPAEWNHSDIGATPIAGDATGNGSSFTVSASGADIWGSADAFHFVQQQASGDWDVEATVATVQNVHAWTKAGVMIRESLSASAPHAAVYVTPGKGISFHYRTAAGGASGAGAAVAGTAPQRIRIARRGNLFTGYRQNTDGSWTQISSSTIAMTGNVYVGLALSSHDNTQLATAQFDAVVTTAR